MSDMRQQNMIGQQMRDVIMQQGMNRTPQQQQQMMEFGMNKMRGGAQDAMNNQPANRGFGRQGQVQGQGGPDLSFRGQGQIQGQGQGNLNGEDQDFRGQFFTDRDEREVMGDLDMRHMGSSGMKQFGANRGRGGAGGIMMGGGNFF